MAIAAFPRQSQPRWIDLQPLASLLAAMRYVASPLGRDPRLDLLRGFCVFAMIVDHIGGTSWLYAVTGGNNGPVTAAEGFVFLSGLVLGIVSRRRVARDGLRAAIRATLARAWTLYALTVVLTLVFLGLTVATDLALWVDRALLGEVESWPGLIASVLLLRFTWHGTDILALYALLLAAAPLALALLAAGRPLLVLVVSWGLWLAFQVAPERVVIPWPIEHATTFPFAAWQLLFFNALTAGYCRDAIASWLEHQPGSPAGGRVGLRAGLSAAAGVLLVLAIALGTGSAHAMDQSLTALSTVDLFDKVSLGPGRLVAFASLALLVSLAVTCCWRPIERAVGWLLIPLGQASLYAYTVHLFLILVAYNVPPYVGSDQPGWELHNSVGQLVLVVVVWTMVTRKVLFGLIPR